MTRTTRTWIAATSIVGGCAVTSVALAQDQLWAKQFGTSASEGIWEIAPDGAGGVFAGGWTAGHIGEIHYGGEDVLLARFDSDGDMIWVKQFGTGLDETINRIAADGNGGVLMAGWTYGSLGGPYQGSRDAWVGVHDADGNPVWHRQISTPAEDWAWGVAPDGTGGVYVTGHTYGVLGEEHFGDRDGFVARYDSEGVQLWIRQFGTSGSEYSFGAASDGAGGVFVAGDTGGDLGGTLQGANDAFIARYDADGNRIAIVQFGTTAYDQIKNIAPDGEGGVFACGHTGGTLGEANYGGNDWIVARFDADLNQVWLTQVGTSAGEQLQACVADGNGGVYTAGGSQGDLEEPNAGGPDAAVARFDDQGGVMWIDQFGTPELDRALSAASDGAGGVLFAGLTQGDLFDENLGGFDAWMARYGCAADLTGDGVVGVEDLVEVVLAWGPCPGCPADLDGDGVVGVNDLVETILGWGPCE